MILLHQKNLTTCCVDFYENDLVKAMIGNSFHPGGLELTQKLAQKIGLNEKSVVLDIASGNGESAIFLAKQFVVLNII